VLASSPSENNKTNERKQQTQNELDLLYEDLFMQIFNPD